MHTILARSAAALLAAVLLTALLVGTVAAAEETFTATLSGEVEVPAGDPDGSGSATIVIDYEAGTLCYEIEVADIEPATASHIHIGAEGEAGDIVINLDTDGFEGSTEGCIEPMEDAQALFDIAEDPAGYYVNVHTADYPGGAVRGQLEAQVAAPSEPESASPAPSMLPDAAVDSPTTGVSGGLIVALAGLLFASAAGFIWTRRQNSER